MGDNRQIADLPADVPPPPTRAGVSATKHASVKQAPRRTMFARVFRGSAQDPDVNITPSGFTFIEPLSPPRDGYASMTMEDLCKTYAQKRAGAIAAGAAVEPEPANRAHDGKQALSEVLRAKLEQVEALERTVQQKTAEAARTSKEITRLRTEAVRLLAEENEKRSLARDFPARAVAARQTSEQQLAEAKIETAELGTELAALKQELKKEEENKRAKQEEAHTVARRAKAKSAEQCELERLVARLEVVRREAAAAGERAQQLAAEVRGATEALNARTDAYNRAVGDFFSAKDKLNGLAHEYARASGEESMMEALIKRYTAEADEAQRVYTENIKRLNELARQLDAAMEAAQQAKQEETRVLEEVARLGADTRIADAQAPHVTHVPVQATHVGEAALRKEKDKTSQERLADVRMERFAEEERLRKLNA